MRAILAGLVLLCLATATSARDYTVDDLLALEGYGKVSISPTGRVAMVERNGRYDGASRFTYGFVTRRMTSRVMSLDLLRPNALSPAFDQERGAGYWTGSFSPSGVRMTVFRLQDDRLTLGVLDVVTREVRWLPGAPDLPIATPSPIWLDDRRIAYVRFASDRLPLILESGGVVQETMKTRWHDAAQGRVAADLGSTRFTGTVPRERREVAIADTTTGSQRVVASGEVFDLQRSPTGSTLVVLELGAALSPDPARPITETYIGRRMRVRLLGTENGSVVLPCPDCDVARGSIRFSKTGRLAFIARRDGAPWADAKGYSFWNGRLEIQDGAVPRPMQLEWVGEKLIGRTADNQWSTVTYSKGERPTALGRYSYVGSDGATLFLSDPQGLWRLDQRLKLARVNPAGFSRTDVDFEDTSSVGSNRLRRADVPILRFTGSSVERVVFGFERDTHVSIDLSRGARLLATSTKPAVAISYGNDERGVGRLYVQSAGAAPKAVDTISRHLADVDPPRAVPLQRRIGRESVIDWLILPRTGGPFPMVVFPYQGGMQRDVLPIYARPGWFSPAFKAQILTTAGYAVLIPSMPAGPAGHPQDTLVADIDAAVDDAVATKLVDGSRVAIFGHSYGGINALVIAARSSRYRAIISANGFNEYAGSYGSVPPAQRTSFVGGPPLDLLNWYENGQGQMGVPPWKDPDRYRRASSFFEADRIAAPVLLIASDLDYAPMEQSEHLFVALARLGLDATLLRVYGDGHVFQSPGNIRLEYETVLRFLREKMPPVAPRGGHPQ